MEVEQLQAPQTQRSSLETGSDAMRAGLGVNPLSASYTAATLPWLCSEARIYTQDAERQMFVVATWDAEAQAPTNKPAVRLLDIR